MYANLTPTTEIESLFLIYPRLDIHTLVHKEKSKSSQFFLHAQNYIPKAFVVKNVPVMVGVSTKIERSLPTEKGNAKFYI